MTHQARYGIDRSQLRLQLPPEKLAQIRIFGRILAQCLPEVALVVPHVETDRRCSQPNRQIHAQHAPPSPGERVEGQAVIQAEVDAHLEHPKRLTKAKEEVEAEEEGDTTSWPTARGDACHEARVGLRLEAQLFCHEKVHVGVTGVATAKKKKHACRLKEPVR